MLPPELLNFQAGQGFQDANALKCLPIKDSTDRASRSFVIPGLPRNLPL